MDRTETLIAASSAVSRNAARFADLVRTQPDLSMPLTGGSTWTAREAAAHLSAGINLYAEIATGIPSPYPSLDRESVTVSNAWLIADIAESDPDKLAGMVLDSVERFLRVTAGRPGDETVPWHAGLPADPASLAMIIVGELLLHGYDIACTAGSPWPIEVDDVLLVLEGYAPLLGLCLNPAATAGHTAAYGIEVRGGPALTVRFADGLYSLEAPGAPVDCELSVDPIAFLLVFTGRLARWPAISLGLISAGGARPELAVGFPDLFVYP